MFLLVAPPSYLSAAMEVVVVDGREVVGEFGGVVKKEAPNGNKATTIRQEE